MAATAPLLLRWFSRVAPDRTPYRLYALSNAGAFIALITYPPLVPLLTKGFVSLLGVRAGVATMGALSSLAPALGLYWSLGQVGLGRRRIVPATLMWASKSTCSVS